jgi:ASC-1-like (ASCH) protein
MTARLEAMIENNQEKTKANLKVIRAGQKKMEAKLDTPHERMMARMDSQLEKMEVYLEKTEATEERVYSGAWGSP